MGDSRGVNIMPLEHAVQRELAYRRNVAKLLSPSDSNFVRELRSMDVQSSSAGPNPTPGPSPSSDSGSSSKLSGLKRQVPTTNSLELLPASLPNELENRMDNLFCKVCEVPCSGYINYKQHIKGKKHKSNLRELKFGERDHDKECEVGNQRLWCAVCKIWCMNEDALKAHLEGQKRKNVELAKKSGKEIATKEWWCELCGIKCIDEPSLKMHFNGKKHRAELQNLRKGGSETVKQPYWCEQCNVWCFDKDSLNRHRQGKRHILQLHGK